MATRAPPATMTLDELFEQASTLTRRHYLPIEHELRSRGAPAAAFLRAKAAALPDPFDCFMAETIADWIDGKGTEFEPMMQQLQQMATRASQTPQRVPRADVVETVLTQSVEDRLVDFIALRLVKETTWPTWKMLGTVLYLHRHQAPSTLPALRRFASQTTHPSARSLALETIAAIEAKTPPSPSP